MQLMMTFRIIPQFLLLTLCISCRCQELDDNITSAVMETAEEKPMVATTPLGTCNLTGKFGLSKKNQIF